MAHLQRFCKENFSKLLLFILGCDCEVVVLNFKKFLKITWFNTWFNVVRQCLCMWGGPQFYIAISRFSCHKSQTV